MEKEKEEEEPTTAATTTTMAMLVAAMNFLRWSGRGSGRKKRKDKR